MDNNQYSNIPKDERITFAECIKKITIEDHNIQSTFLTDLQNTYNIQPETVIVKI